MFNRISFAILFTLFWIVGAVILLIEIFIHPLHNSAWDNLASSNLLLSLLVILAIFSLLNLIAVLISLLILTIDMKDADLLIKELTKINLIVSIVIGLLLTERSDDFQLIATTISFILVFQYFFPKEIKDVFIDTQRKFIDEWKKQSKSKKKKQVK